MQQSFMDSQLVTSKLVGILEAMQQCRQHWQCREVLPRQDRAVLRS